MDIVRIFGIIRGNRLLVSLGVLLGIVAALAVSYRLESSSGVVRLAPKSRTLYSTQAELLISEPRLGMGRAGLEPNVPDPFRKTVEMAPTYSRLLVSDAVRSSVEEQLGPLGETAVEASPLPDSPIIALRVSGYDAERILDVADTTCAAFAEYLAKQQAGHGVPEQDRLTVNVLASPSSPKAEQSRDIEVALLAFMAPLLLAVGVAVLKDRGAQPRVIEVREPSPSEMHVVHRRDAAEVPRTVE